MTRNDTKRMKRSHSTISRKIGSALQVHAGILSNHIYPSATSRPSCDPDVDLPCTAFCFTLQMSSSIRCCKSCLRRPSPVRVRDRCNFTSRRKCHDDTTRRRGDDTDNGVDVGVSVLRAVCIGQCAAARTRQGTQTHTHNKTPYTSGASHADGRVEMHGTAHSRWPRGTRQKSSANNNNVDAPQPGILRCRRRRRRVHFGTL